MIIESYEDVIILSGALRSNFWETIHTAISLTLKRHPSGVIIDCSALTEATPQGAETFRDAMEFIANHHDSRIIVAAVPPAVMDVLRNVPEVRSQLAVAASVEEARHSIDLLHLDDEPKQKQKRVGNATKLIVCLYTGTSIKEDNSAMSVASRIADSAPTEVHLVCLLLVPRHLPLQSPLHQQEESASDAVDRAVKFFQARNVSHVAHVERARDVASGLQQVLDEVDAPLIVLPLIHDSLKKDDNLKLVESVIGKIEREVVFVRG